MNLGDAKRMGGKRARRRRIGRGPGSGMGKTAGRGSKGAGARAGRLHHRSHAGGQVPFFRRFPKRGFTDIFGTVYAVVNVEALEKAFQAGDEVDLEALRRKGLVKQAPQGVKVLGDGTLSKALTVRVQAASESAKAKIVAAGGTVTVVPAPAGQRKKERLEGA